MRTLNELCDLPKMTDPADVWSACLDAQLAWEKWLEPALPYRARARAAVALIASRRAYPQLLADAPVVLDAQSFLCAWARNLNPAPARAPRLSPPRPVPVGGRVARAVCYGFDLVDDMLSVV